MKPGRPSLVGRIREQAEFPKRLLQHRTEQIRCSIPGTTSKRVAKGGTTYLDAYRLTGITGDTFTKLMKRVVS